MWEKTFGGAGSDSGYCVQLTGDGGYIIIGYTESFSTSPLDTGGDVYLVKVDGSGNLVWQKTFGGDNHDYGYSVQLTGDGGYVVAGWTKSFGAGGGDVYLVKFLPLIFEVSGLTVNPSQVAVNKPVTVSVTVKNVGELFGDYTVELKVNGATEDTKKVTLAGGTQTVVRFTVTKAVAGFYYVVVGSLSGSFTVWTPLKPAAISVKTLQISKTLAKPGEEIEVTATLENTGEQSGSCDLVINLDGVEKYSSTVTVESGKTVAKIVRLSSSFEGVHKVTADGKSIEFEVKKEASGIDGFPFEAVTIGLMLAVILLVAGARARIVSVSS